MYNKILIIDDNKEILTALKIFLRNYFKEIFTLSSPVQLYEMLDKHAFDVIMLDMNFKAGKSSGNEGLFWLGEILKKDSNLSVICITAYGEVGLAVQALKAGAVDFIEKPWKEELLLAAIMRAAKLSDSQQTIKKLKKKNQNLTNWQSQASGFIRGHSPKMQQVWETVEKVAPTDANILITGENGSGKEVIARRIHQLSERKNEAFIPVDLGALVTSLFESELFGHVKGAFTDAKQDKTGWFELAHGGTIFLDEIGNLELAQQAKLLSVIQNKEITPVGSMESRKTDVRIISATNANITERVQQNQFREDLLYRLNTIAIEVPPLRQRTEDLPDLLDFYLKKFQTKYHKGNFTVDQRVMERLKQYPWPGNIRELRQCAERAVILSRGNKLKFSDFRIHAVPGNELTRETDTLNLEIIEKHSIAKAIENTGGNYSKASELLGISRKTLYNKISKYGL